MTKILGLDLGTNSIGWAMLDDKENCFIKAGSRILPMDAKTLGEFENGNTISPANARTKLRGVRRLYERSKLRRERLLRTLNILGFLPQHFKDGIDFIAHPGQFIDNREVLLPFRSGIKANYEFIFQDSFNEMLNEFRSNKPMLFSDGKKVPYDWTIYYLRHKALSKPISKEELAWILLQFNTKRGYFQLRDEMVDEESEAPTKTEEYTIVKVTKVERLDPDKKHVGNYWYEITFDDKVTLRRTSTNPPMEIGQEMEAIITTQLDKNGEVKVDKNGKSRISLRLPSDTDWTLQKKRTEKCISESGDTVGTYIYKQLLADPNVKIKGKVVRVIERKYYKDEIEKILKKQKEFIPELSDINLLGCCVRDLYNHNEAHVSHALKNDTIDFLINDVLFYQRPLKSKKSEISNCPFETYNFVDKTTGEIINRPIKCIPKSNPFFQEFRLWQFINNLRIVEKERNVNGVLRTDVDVTNEFLKSEKDITDLFEWLNGLEKIQQNQLIKHFVKKESGRYRWNYVEDKTYPCNETLYEITKRMKLVNSDIQLGDDQIMNLWHISYSVSDVLDLKKALSSFAKKNHIDVTRFVDVFMDIKPFDKAYGAYSEKAIKKLLPLMRIGKYWKEDAIDSKTHAKIESIVNGDTDIDLLEKCKVNNLHHFHSFRFLPLWLATLIVYGIKEQDRWEKPEDIDYYLKYTFKQNSLRNPIVQSVLSETLRVIRDIWKTYGKIDEIHIEMGRDLKANAQERKKQTENILRDEQINQRVRLLLQEFVNPEYRIDNIRPFSPSQQEILKIYETQALEQADSDDQDYLIIADNLGKNKHVSNSDIMRYRLWLEQKYRSPYTGQVIPLSKLFTPAYEIEHIIPQSRYFDDSLSNKVICESEVNKLKDSMLGYEFIQKHAGEIVTKTLGGNVKVFDVRQYEEFIKQNYSSQPAKKKKLLMDDIPDTFIQRQLNDSRYISRQAIEILSNVVRNENEKTLVSSKIIATNGRITDRLKKDWGINDIWNDIISPRFERLNSITKSQDFGQWVNNDGRRYFQINVPLSISKGFSKKRIDHRHHAMDAMIIACTTRNMVNYLNGTAALTKGDKQRYDLQHVVCDKVKVDDNGNYSWRVKKPWDSYTQDVHSQLQGIIVSFKQNLRVINKMTNFYWRYEDGKKVLTRQTVGDGWAIRKSLHKATFSGAVRLQDKKNVKFSEALKDWHQIADKQVRKAIKDVIALYKHYDINIINQYFKDRGYKIGDKDISKVELYVIPQEPTLSSTRKLLDDTFDEKTIQSITDSGIRSILQRYLTYKGGDPKIAFSPIGIAELNKNIKQYNNGHDHKPILRVKKSEAINCKFSVGSVGSKSSKFVEADKGTNLFFAIYSDDLGNRSYASVPLNEAVERLKNGLPVADAELEDGSKLLFVLSPLDLVYVPEENEYVSKITDKRKIYKMVSSTAKSVFFIPESIAHPIIDTVELGANNKAEKDWKGVPIKQVCYKIKVDRLGNAEIVK